jgi:zinc transporter ZupT
MVEEIIPEIQWDKFPDLTFVGFMLGFTVRMIVEVALG